MEYRVVLGFERQPYLKSPLSNSWFWGRRRGFEGGQAIRKTFGRVGTSCRLDNSIV